MKDNTALEKYLEGADLNYNVFLIHSMCVFMTQYFYIVLRSVKNFSFFTHLFFFFLSLQQMWVILLIVLVEARGRKGGGKIQTGCLRVMELIGDSHICLNMAGKLARTHTHTHVQTRERTIECTDALQPLTGAEAAVAHYPARHMT